MLHDISIVRPMTKGRQQITLAAMKQKNPHGVRNPVRVKVLHDISIVRPMTKERHQITLAAMKQRQPLQHGCVYHIYNRGNNRENLFREERNYRYFLQLYARHVSPVADTFAYCLLRNHFHLLVRTKGPQEPSRGSEPREGYPPTPTPTQAFSHCFNAYAQGFNKAYGRTGSLFESSFKRIEVTTDRYFTQLLFYIHFNPQKHGFVKDFREWPWSSYSSLLDTKPTRLQRAEVMDWFGNTQHFQNFHQGIVDEKAIATLIGDDFD